MKGARVNPECPIDVIAPPPNVHPHGQECDELIRERVRIEDDLSRAVYADKGVAEKARLAGIENRIAELEAADLENHAKRKHRHSCRYRTVELAYARVLEFLGAPGVQMQAAARLCGQCCCCWKTLTDPISLERGIGPECWAHIVHSIQRVYRNTGSVEQTVQALRLSTKLIESVIADHFDCDVVQAS
jgi:hypothetical protein